MFKKANLLVLLAVIVLLGGITFAVLAETLGPMSSEYGVEPIDSVPPIHLQVLGDDPDEDSFQREVPVNEGEIIPPSDEGENPDVNIDWEALLQGEPDTDDGAVEETREGEPRWSEFKYAFVAGSTLTPRSSATAWAYPGAGCVYLSSGNELLTIDLQLPQGSRIDYLRIFYYDTSTNNSTAWITSYSGSGTTVDLINVQSVGTSGYGTNLSPYVGHVVDNANKSYVLNYRLNQTGNTMRLCGLRVAYRLAD